MQTGLAPVTPQKSSVALYSCYFGRHEPLNPDAMGDGDGCDRIVFTDHADLPLPGVRQVRLSQPGLAPDILARLPKLRPHLFFQGYDWVIYIDNRARLLRPARELVDLAEAEGGGALGRHLFRHPQRDCAYREAAVCKRIGRIDAADYARTVVYLEASGFPRNAGLYVNTLLVQRMGAALTDRMNDIWFANVAAVARRDQIMLPYAIWLTGCPVHGLPDRIREFVDWPVFSWRDRTRFQRGHRTSAAAADESPDLPLPNPARSD